MHYARGPAPRRVREGCTYGPAFIAKLIVDKCADATPIYRIEKAMARAGIPVSRSTMNELCLLGAEVLQPLHALALSEMRSDPHVQADETSFRLQTSSVRLHSAIGYLSPADFRRCQSRCVPRARQSSTTKVGDSRASRCENDWRSLARGNSIRDSGDYPADADSVGFHNVCEATPVYRDKC